MSAFSNWKSSTNNVTKMKESRDRSGTIFERDVPLKANENKASTHHSTKV